MWSRQRCDPHRQWVGEVFDCVVPHGVVERDFLAGGDGSAGDEVVSSGGVEADAAVGLAGVVHLGDKPGVQNKPALTDLGGVGVVVVEFAVDAAYHHRLTELEGPGDEDAVSCVGRCPQFEPVAHRRLLPTLFC
jgi:hypothetical protein